MRGPSARRILLLLALAANVELASARPRDAGNAVARASAEVPWPYLTNRVHHTGFLKLNLTNRGVISAQTWLPVDACNPHPTGSGVGYLYTSGLWVGGVVGRDTLVSVAQDDNSLYQEFLPSQPPDGEFEELTTLDSLARPRGYVCPPPLKDSRARSDQDLLVTYTDSTMYTHWVEPDPFDGPHRALGIQVRQRSQTWVRGYGHDIAIIDYEIQNIGTQAIRDAYVGWFADHDVGGFEDDWAGFIHDVPALHAEGVLDTIETAWCADNDGDPEGSSYGTLSPTRALGVRFLRVPQTGCQLSFNWWVSGLFGLEGWGPVLRRNANLRNPYILPIFEPLGDQAKYWMMKNGELDYDQELTALNHEAQGWLPPPANDALAADIANGFDSRFLLSAGPFDLEPGAMAPLTVAIVAGREFHVEPGAFQAYWDHNRPQYYASRLDFAGVVNAARWAGCIFDTPGVDTDGDGWAGAYTLVGADTVYTRGDGVPDFNKPSPPPAPNVRLTRLGDELRIAWNGERSETGVDPFLRQPDFEGYRVYVSRSGSAADYALVGQRDLIDYNRFEWNSGAQRWLLREVPLTLDSLESLYAPLSGDLGFAFHPDSFSVPDTSRALIVVRTLANDPHAFDTSLYYFEPYAGNLCADDVALHNADSVGLAITGVIRKVHPHALPDLVEYDDQGLPYRPYYEYEMVLTDLHVSVSLSVAVTAFDFGYAAFGQEALEVPPESVRLPADPGAGVTYTADARPKPGLFPNPYRLADDYQGRGWENPLGIEPDPERARQVTFYNLPDPCTITIWTLDGDLVRKLSHGAEGRSSATDQEVWNLITRNGQSVRTGLYIWCVESRYGADVGKLAVLR